MSSATLLLDNEKALHAYQTLSGAASPATVPDDEDDDLLEEDEDDDLDEEDDDEDDDDEDEGLDEDEE